MSRFNPTTFLRKLRTCAAVMAACLAGGVPPVQATFDPVNDDTDIFLANPNVEAQRPNILINLDNSANWNAAFTNEQAALVSVFNSLTADFNVGLSMYVETGSPNDNVDGGYIRYAVRQMTPANRSVLAQLVGGLHVSGDRSNNNAAGLTMLEINRYYAGLASRSTFGKGKSDIATHSTHEAVVANLGEYALNNSTAGTLFNSPTVDGCQSNFIIQIVNTASPGNPQPSEPQNLQDFSEDELDSLGYDTETPIPLTFEVSQQTLGGNWGDEWADYMANTDIDQDPDNGDQHVFTYVVEVDPLTNAAGNDNTLFWKSMADKGKGQYFGVSSGNAGQSIINALNQIFQEVQAVNSVFASTTLPVSVNVRGTNLNQVYIGVFRPDAEKSPRWFGNLKMYQLGVASGALFLADAVGNPAENPDSGFINPTSPSFWTTGSSFWGFRDAELNGPGGVSDNPDGDLVEKGGTGQQQRVAYVDESTTPRKLYTCTSGTVDCEEGDLLSATPFSTANDGITAGGLQLGVAAVSTLTGFDAQSITSLTDTKTVSGISTAFGSPITINSLDNGATNKTVTNLVTTKTATITSIVTDPTVSKSFNGLTRSAGANPKQPALATVNNHGWSDGQIVHISGVGATEFNGTFVIDVTGPNTFTYSSALNLTTGTPDTSLAVVATTTTTAIATTSTAHSFSIGDQVVISGVSPSTWNNGGVAYQITNTNSPTNTTFQFSTSAALAPATTGGTATGPSTVATATVANHGYPNGSKVRISGATPAGYNGVFSIFNVTPNTFQYTVPGNLANATGTITANQGSGTLVTADAPGHGFGDGSNVSITISSPDPSEFSGSFPISFVDADTFTYNTSIRVPGNLGTGITALSGTSTNASATVTNHGFEVGDDVIIEGVTGPDATATGAYNGTHTIETVPTVNTFTFSVDPALPEAATTSGTITARLSTGTAFATVVGHGYSTSNAITIKGASVSEYNRNDVAITVIDADNFKYPISTITAKGAATGTITANKKGTTAKVRAVAHGFSDGNAVQIDTSPGSVFEGTFTITYVDADNFTYDLHEVDGSIPAQGDATGTITASFGSGSSGDLADLINWVRGADNFEDENSDGLATDPRSTMQGDVLHSRPAVVNYNRFDDSNGGADNDVYIFFGSNDGVFRAVKGGFDAATGEPEPGGEAWGFIPEEFFSKLQRVRNNEPKISSSNKKPYFADGTLGVYVRDVNDDGDPDPEVPGDGKLDDLTDPDGAGPMETDKVWLFISMRRGGRFLYALDVTVPTEPRLLWKKQAGVDLGFAELGFTWSAPQVRTLAINDGKPVLIFGAGYDPLVEDLDPATITGLTATQVQTTSGNFDRSMGRGVYVLDAETGEILWQAGPSVADPTDDPTPATHHFETVSGMDYAIPSDVTVITDRNGSVDNRAYVGDTGGNMWRIDMASDDVDDWTVTKLAAVQDASGLSATPDDPSGLRKFLFPPDVVYSEEGYDAVLVGSGDREHPFDVSVTNRFYMFKDEGIGTTPVTDDLEEDDLFDATSDCIQDADACTGGDTPDTAIADLTGADGWYITLEEGEKVVGNAVTLNNVTFFNTNVPTSVAEDDSCESDLGVARQYKVLFDTAESFADQNNAGGVDALDRFTEHPGGGYLPSPVPVVVEIDGKVYEGVISGVAVDKPPGSLLNARLRKYWYKDMD